MSLDVAERHFKYLEKANKLYSKVMKSKSYYGLRAASLVSVCKKDIALASAVWKYFKPTTKSPPAYPSFHHLAALYEKRGKYKKAIRVYKKALAKGYTDDGTSTSIPKRIEQLKKNL